MNNCINCNREVETPFCGHCGQSQQPTLLTNRAFLKQLINTISLVNSPLKKTVLALWQSPGVFVHNFAKGKRVGYLNSVSFFIMLLALYVIIAPLIIDFNLSQFSMGVAQNTSAERQPSRAISVMNYIRENAGELKEFIKQGINFFYFFFPFALYFYMPKNPLAKEKGLLLSAAFYYVAMSLLMAVPFLLLSLLYQPLLVGRFLVATIYLTFAFHRFYREIKKHSVFSLLVRVLMSYLTYLLFVGLIMSTWIISRLIISGIL
jgi:hypothetical protein